MAQSVNAQEEAIGQDCGKERLSTMHRNWLMPISKQGGGGL